MTGSASLHLAVFGILVVPSLTLLLAFVPEDTKVVVERIHLYENTIRYWDVENDERRTFILQELASTGDAPGCPRIRYPLICDSNGTLLENPCYFRMKREETPDLVPIMVFATTTTEFEYAGKLCTNELRQNPYVGHSRSDRG